MTVHGVRGTKRTCQNEECGVRFYDLMRNPIACPICHSPFVPPPVRDADGAPRTYPSAFHRPSASSLQAPQAPEKELELQPAPTNGDDADTEIEPESPDAILEPEEEDADNSSGILPLPERKKD
jgi:hypothetical protein